jgi:hypothetical protein
MLLIGKMELYVTPLYKCGKNLNIANKLIKKEKLFDLNN